MKPNETSCSGRLARLRRIRLLLLVGVLVALVGGEMTRRVATAGSVAYPESAASTELGVRELLAHVDRCMAQAQARAAEPAGRGEAALRIASLELGRSGALLLLAYEKQRARRKGAPEMDCAEYRAWGERFLRTDPDGTLTRAVRAAREALRSDLDPTSRRWALLTLVRAHGSLGNYRAECEALAEVARSRPDDAALWERLARAYGRARQFVRAEAAMSRSLDISSKEK